MARGVGQRGCGVFPIIAQARCTMRVLFLGVRGRGRGWMNIFLAQFLSGVGLVVESGDLGLLLCTETGD